MTVRRHPGRRSWSNTADYDDRVLAAGAESGPAERHFPIPVVVGHGALAATTLVLVLLTLASAAADARRRAERGRGDDRAQLRTN